MSGSRELRRNLPQRSRNIDGKMARAGDIRGYFSDESMIRRIGREALVLLGAGRAVLLQIAHPLVAAGVKRYSSFQKDPLARLMRTMRFMHALVFGNRAQAQAALDRFNSTHDRITGSLKRRVGTYQTGSRYSGQDLELKIWVFATLIHSSKVAYRTFIRDMSAQESGDYYNDALVLGELMGIPQSRMPENVFAFDDYMKGMLKGNELAVSTESKRMAHHVLYPQVDLKLGVSARLLRLATAGLLPDRFRERFGLRWTKADRVGFHTLKRVTRFLRPVSPPQIWAGPLQPRGSLARFLLSDTEISIGK